MNVTICERSCGKTSLDPDADIQPMTVKARHNGQESVYEAKIEACRACRESMYEQLRTMFVVSPIVVTVSKEALAYREMTPEEVKTYRRGY